MVNNIKHYCRLYWHLIKFSAQMETEYRGSFVLEILVEVAFFAATIAGLMVVFSNINELAGWGKYQLLILMGINQIFAEIVLGASFILNLRELPFKIAQGSLDGILTKPVNSQFVVSLWRPYFASIPSLIAGILVICWSFIHGGISFSPWVLVPFVLIFLSGIVIAYSLGMIISTLSVWLINATPLPFLAQQVIFLARNPYSVFSGLWRVIFLVFVPLAFMVSFPAQSLLGQLVWWWVPVAFLLAALFLKVSNIFWLFALRHYSSASS